MSTITVRCILYSVPSRLIGYRLTLHLYHDKLLGFVEAEQVVCLPRIYAPKHSRLRRARCVNYRHVIDSLRRKPRAFLHCQWQQDLLPTPTYRELWRQLQAQLPPSQACRLMVEVLQDKPYFQVCQECEQRNPCGWMHNDGICQSCAERNHGIVY